MEIHLPGNLPPTGWAGFRRRLALRIDPALAAVYHTNAQLRERNLDLHHQNTDLRAAKPIHPHERKLIEEREANRKQMFEEQQKITVWIRNNMDVFNNHSLAGLSFPEMIIRLISGAANKPHEAPAADSADYKGLQP